MAAKMAQQNTKPRSRIWRAKRILAEELERLGASETAKETVAGEGLRTLRRPGIVNVVGQLGHVRNGMELTGERATSCQTHASLLWVSAAGTALTSRAAAPADCSACRAPIINATASLLPSSLSFAPWVTALEADLLVRETTVTETGHGRPGDFDGRKRGATTILAPGMSAVSTGAIETEETGHDHHDETATPTGMETETDTEKASVSGIGIGDGAKNVMSPEKRER